MSPAERKVLVIKQALGLQTRLANDIQNEFNPNDPHERDEAVCKRLSQLFPRAVARTSRPSYGYNCHGLTFAARRTQVYSSSDVQHILREDGYEPIEMRQALPGDIIIYQSQDSREYEHSGIVIERASSGMIGPKVVSKWGPSQEFIHYYADCPYMPADVTFHRMCK